MQTILQAGVLTVINSNSWKRTQIKIKLKKWKRQISMPKRGTKLSQIAGWKSLGGFSREWRSRGSSGAATNGKQSTPLSRFSSKRQQGSEICFNWGSSLKTYSLSSGQSSSTPWSTAKIAFSAKRQVILNLKARTRYKESNEWSLKRF